MITWVNILFVSVRDNLSLHVEHTQQLCIFTHIQLQMKTIVAFIHACIKEILR